MLVSILVSRAASTNGATYLVNVVSLHWYGWLYACDHFKNIGFQNQNVFQAILSNFDFLNPPPPPQPLPESENTKFVLVSFWTFFFFYFFIALFISSSHFSSLHLTFIS